MKSKITFLILSVLLPLLLNSCSTKNSPVTPDNTVPYIESIKPTTVYIGSSITITGKNFGDSQSSNFVELNGIKPAASDYYSWSATEIKVKVPANVTSGKLYVTVGSKISNGVDFTIKTLDASSPQITALTQVIGQEGQQTTLVGKNFGAAQGNSYVEFNGTKVTQYGKWTDTQILVTVPTGAKSGDVIAYINNVPTNSKYFTIQASFKLLDMVLVPKGTFSMGDDNSSELTDKPAHTVNITRDFYMSKCEITQKQWATIMDGSNPSHERYKGELKPVEQVVFLRACEFCNRLSMNEGFKSCYTIDTDLETVTCDWTANGYRLPTEAEWEYACKANHKGDYTTQEIADICWYSDNSVLEISDVGQKNPNAFGLFDMLGNVYEWCWDLDGEYTSSSQNDPKGPSASDGDQRITRGGSFNSDISYCSTTRRYPMPSSVYNYNLGFRVVRLK